ncbi:hypothetical protein [Acinetobacter baumannii]|uniref:hypothetical protein n=1 Tax=Acinetobacter baumannii TaxID=470 RepID=UPI000DE7326C|nr:hypothetical protein [Acinetobacter baumannii]SSW76709.1 Uncharacterised protein [Klebsiella pneumoniae]MBJ9699818.1 hypothetical protein [Acinetobacter baumannii]MBJ9742653.1 hypothetical protein [Acinetobacter baumannii]MBK5981919.1 hypothetical protein [Acinetobacter baumannii]MCZ3368621.1 hypothetical protein [Acinetobacter baumannii]
MKYLDINAPIIPSKSIGNICIGDALSDYLNMIDENIKKEILIENIDTNERKITFGKLPVEIFVKKDFDKIYKISAGIVYQGKFNGIISVGDKAKDIFGKDSSFYYNDLYESILSRNYEGIILEFSNEEPWDENIRIENLRVCFITIFNPQETPF